MTRARPDIRNAAKANHYGKGDPQLYESDPAIFRALAKADPFFWTPQLLWEPACGPGKLVGAMLAAGHMVLASDLYDYEDRFECHGAERLTGPHWGNDFLQTAGRMGAAAILTNSPFNDGTGRDVVEAWIDHALTLAPRAYFYLPLSRLCGGAGRGSIRDRLMDHHLTGLMVCRERDTMHRDDFKGRKAAGSIPTAWFRFERAPQPGASKTLLRFTKEGGGDVSKP